jgi:hypothetical protein
MQVKYFVEFVGIETFYFNYFWMWCMLENMQGKLMFEPMSCYVLSAIGNAAVDFVCRGVF